MHGLSASELLTAWERGLSCPAAARGLLLLAASWDGSADDLSGLSLGERDAQLLTLRELTFGAALTGLATCPACGGTAEFSFGASDVRRSAEAAANLDPVVTPDYDLRFRLPDTSDLLAIADAPNATAGRRTLIERCVSATDRSSTAVEVEEIPDTVVAAVIERMARADPQADVQIAITCPACAHAWKSPFDIASFFWTEVQAYAARLLRDVHRLARAYGWRESDILAMSPVRREAYLGLLSE